ncbi:MAG: FAD-dependent oxidoreductase [Gammaproteobacteria bacterium]|nr:FAD-dependent oxidoreductase [Gammaproteobacteria bacterium]
MTDSVLIIGSGVAGLNAAIECANAGAKVIVVERNPIVGGKLAAPMTDATAIGDRAEGEKIPLFDALAENNNIEIFTMASLESIDGGPGNFTATIHERARFVTDACTRCKLCRAVCPVVLGNEYDAGLTFRKAIYTPMSETLPEAYVIDIENCLNTPPNYLPCNRCVEVCDDDAIHFDMAFDTLHERHVGAVILAPGFQVEGGAGFAELGYGEHPDIVTSAELQRLLESPGPTGGYASKPSNEEYPDKVLLVLDYLSRFGLYIAASQAHQLIKQDVGTVAVLVLAQPDTSVGPDEITRIAAETGMEVRWGMMFRAEASTDDQLQVSYEDRVARKYVQDFFDMVVLCTDVSPPDGLAEVAETVGIELNDDGYLATDGTNGDGIATSKPAILVAGCASGPKTIRESIDEARAAASSAIERLDPRVLSGDAPDTAGAPAVEPKTERPPDDMQQQIEKLLYALIGDAR